MVLHKCGMNLTVKKSLRVRGVDYTTSWAKWAWPTSSKLREPPIPTGKGGASRTGGWSLYSTAEHKLTG